MNFRFRTQKRTSINYMIRPDDAGLLLVVYTACSHNERLWNDRCWRKAVIGGSDSAALDSRVACLHILPWSC